MTHMRTFKNIIIVFFLFVCQCSYATMYGVFYGANIDGLECPENDMTDLAELYRKNNGNVLLLNGGGVTKQIVLDCLKIQSKQAKEDDILIFAYSGHGNDGIIQCGLDESISFEEIKNITNISKAKRKVFIISSCYSGTFSRHGKISIPSDGSVIAITASQPNEEAYEQALDRNSILFKHLLNGLKGKADKNDDGRIVAKELYDYLSHKIKRIQHPMMVGKFNDSMLLYTYKPMGQNKAHETHQNQESIISSPNTFEANRETGNGLKSDSKKHLSITIFGIGGFVLVILVICFFKTILGWVVGFFCQRRY